MNARDSPSDRLKRGAHEAAAESSKEPSRGLSTAPQRGTMKDHMRWNVHDDLVAVPCSGAAKIANECDSSRVEGSKMMIDARRCRTAHPARLVFEIGGSDSLEDIPQTKTASCGCLDGLATNSCTRNRPLQCPPGVVSMTTWSSGIHTSCPRREIRSLRK